MRQFILILALATGWAGASRAQGNPARPDGPGRDKIEAQRVAFITNRLALTSEESAKFWPVYNEHRAAMKNLREDWTYPNLATMSDPEAEKLLDEQLRQEYRKLDMRKELVARLRGILPARKILMIAPAEAAFNRELLRRMQENRPLRQP